MAGKERGGFTASAEDLYVGASMILTPDKRTDMRLLETLKAFFLDLGFGGPGAEGHRRHRPISGAAA